MKISGLHHGLQGGIHILMWQCKNKIMHRIGDWPSWGWVVGTLVGGEEVERWQGFLVEILCFVPWHSTFLDFPPNIVHLSFHIPHFRILEFLRALPYIPCSFHFWVDHNFSHEHVHHTYPQTSRPVSLISFQVPKHQHATFHHLQLHVFHCV